MSLKYMFVLTVVNLCLVQRAVSHHLQHPTNALQQNADSDNPCNCLNDLVNEELDKLHNYVLTITENILNALETIPGSKDADRDESKTVNVVKRSTDTEDRNKEVEPASAWRLNLNVDKKMVRADNDFKVTISSNLDANKKVMEALETINERLERMESILWYVAKTESTAGLESAANRHTHEEDETKKDLDKSNAVVDLSWLLGSSSADLNSTKFTPLCEVEVPKSIVISDDIWRRRVAPVKDDLDEYVVKETGCKYGYATDLRTFPFGNTTFEGSLEQHFALRAPSSAGVFVRWGVHDYGFVIGYGDNSDTVYYQASPYHWEPRSTPDILSPLRYVPFYLKLENQTLSFGKLCDSEPLFVRNMGAAIPKGELVRFAFGSESSYGGKFLYDCPSQDLDEDAE